MKISTKKLILWQMCGRENTYLQCIIYQIATHHRKTIDENSILEVLPVLVLDYPLRYISL